MIVLRTVIASEITVKWLWFGLLEEKDSLLGHVGLIILHHWCVDASPFVRQKQGERKKFKWKHLQSFIQYNWQGKTPIKVKIIMNYLKLEGHHSIKYFTPAIKMFRVWPIFILFHLIKYLHALLKHPVECRLLKSISF